MATTEGRKDGILNAIPMKATIIFALHNLVFVNSSNYAYKPD